MDWITATQNALSQSARRNRKPRGSRHTRQPNRRGIYSARKNALVGPPAHTCSRKLQPVLDKNARSHFLFLVDWRPACLPKSNRREKAKSERHVPKRVGRTERRGGAAHSGVTKQREAWSCRFGPRPANWRAERRTRSTEQPPPRHSA